MLVLDNFLYLVLRKRRASSLLQSDQREMTVVVEVSAKSEDSLDSLSTKVTVSINEFNKTVDVSSEDANAPDITSGH